jgi:REP element-mobilizing transposase RayT
MGVQAFQALYLAAIFAIEVCAYAIMANHYHTILRIRPDIAVSWSDWEVALKQSAGNHLNLAIPQEALTIRMLNCLGKDQKSSWASSSESQISIDSR